MPAPRRRVPSRKTTQAERQSTENKILVELYKFILPKQEGSTPETQEVYLVDVSNRPS